MSQPSSIKSNVPAPGKVDESLGEFWEEDPWSFPSKGHNLSAYERKRAFLNVRGRNFLDISHLTGADDDGDGRAVVAGDFRNDGRLDLVVRLAGGDKASVLLYQNEFPKRHYLKVTLRGRPEAKSGYASTRQGIGARLTLVANGQKQVREMFPYTSYQSQMPNLAHFGLADTTLVERLTIRWPSGKVQELTDLPVDCQIVVDEGKSGKAAISVVVPGNTIEP